MKTETGLWQKVQQTKEVLMPAINDKEYGGCSDSGHVRTCRQRYREELHKCQASECTEEKISFD